MVFGRSVILCGWLGSDCQLTNDLPLLTLESGAPYSLRSEVFPVYSRLPSLPLPATSAPQWGAADAEIKVPSGENTELNRSPFKVWSRSVYSHTCYAYCQEFLPRLFLPFRSIYLHFFQILSQFFPVLAVANSGSCVGPQNKIGHPVGCRFPC